LDGKVGVAFNPVLKKRPPPRARRNRHGLSRTENNPPAASLASPLIFPLPTMTTYNVDNIKMGLQTVGYRLLPSLCVLQAFVQGAPSQQFSFAFA
jgi:hypothetical protein